MFEVVDETDSEFDTSNNNDGDDDKNKSINNRDNSVEGDVLTNNKLTTADLCIVFFRVVNANLPNIAFLSGGLFFFVMVAMNDEVLFIQPEK